MAIDKLEQNHPKDKLCAWSRGGAAAAWLGLLPGWPRVAPFITSIGVSWVYIIGFPFYIYETHGLLIDTRPTVAAVTELSRGGRTAMWRLLMPSPLHKPSAFLTVCQHLCRNKSSFCAVLGLCEDNPSHSRLPWFFFQSTRLMVYYAGWQIIYTWFTRLNTRQHVFFP